MSRTSHRPVVADIREAIAGQIRRRPLTVCLVAGELNSSRSEVQRALAAAGTTFTSELRDTRLRTAVRMLHRGATVAHAAAAVGVSPDHLRVLFVEAFGIAPGALRRAITLLLRVHRWRRQVPPRYGTPLYWGQRRRWSDAYGELQRRLAVIPPHSPLVRWANDALDYARRPDYRRNPHRQEIKRARQREHELETYRLQEVLVALGWPSEQTPISGRRGRPET